MYTASAGLKTALRGTAPELEAYIQNGDDTISASGDLAGIAISTRGGIGRTVMRELKGSFAGEHNVLDNYVTAHIGTRVSSTPTYVNYGSFKVVEIKQVDDSDLTEFRGYDKMYEFQQQYELEIDFTTPKTIKQILQAICDEVGVTLGTASFVNDDIEYLADPFVGVGYTYRDVLEDIAEASGSVAIIDEDDELVLKSVGSSVETITQADVFESKVQSLWGELNRVTLSRIEVDNILEQDDDSIEEYGLFEYKIVDNIVVDQDREAYVSPLFTHLFGLKYYPCRVKTFGLLWLEVGDFATILDNPVLITGIEIDKHSVVIESLPLEASRTEYATAGVIGRAIKNTEIKVDKQNSQIDLLVDDVTSLTLSTEGIQATAQSALETAQSNSESISDLDSEITQLNLRADGLELSVEGIGGSNLLLNSVGLKGALEEWREVFIADDTETRNDGSIITTASVINNTESRSAIRIVNQYIQQTVPTIVGERYALFFRFNKNGQLDCTVSGIGTFEVTGDNNEWLVFKTTFTAISTTTTIRLETGAGITATLSDLVVKTGDVSGWVQAPNEVYGIGYRFDREGLKISRPNSGFESLLDDVQIRIKNLTSDRIVMQVNKDAGLITRLVVQDDFVVQRYEEPSQAGRFIPTDNGVYLVIND
jgi:hypothetical protein